MSRSFEYVCPTCGARIERPFRVPSVARTCDNGCPFGHFLRTGLLERVEEVPEEARPDDWAERDAEERLHVAVREGIVTPTDLR
ncbi:hypothetical protein ACFPYI_01230 [Halomarina salina]|uniref:Zinc ribbon domain-containing protein n=1 Tax=Halomarina salina TaxID=1872699 RepID=A0ABD5RI13_9EURY|nr:hypothetical protein [Halomarina salina]